MIMKAFSKEYFKELKDLRKKNILFFNGCFDIIHPGHLQLIKSIKIIGNNCFPSNGYKIICGLNSDESVKKQNKSHPLVNKEKDRGYFLEQLGVDYIFTFDEETPTSLIMSLMPDKIIKGIEYYAKDFHEKDFCYKSGIDIEYTEQVVGYSTTSIYNKIYDIAKEDIIKNLK